MADLPARIPPRAPMLAGVCPLIPRLGLRPREAAEALGISPRMLSMHQHEIPHLRLGNAVIFPVAELTRWLSERAAKGGVDADRD
jgi:hypothetical protein